MSCVGFFDFLSLYLTFTSARCWNKGIGFFFSALSGAEASCPRSELLWSPASCQGGQGHLSTSPLTTFAQSLGLLSWSSLSKWSTAFKVACYFWPSWISVREIGEWLILKMFLNYTRTLCFWHLLDDSQRHSFLIEVNLRKNFKVSVIFIHEESMFFISNTNENVSLGM